MTLYPAQTCAGSFFCQIGLTKIVFYARVTGLKLSLRPTLLQIRGAAVERHDNATEGTSLENRSPGR